MQQDNAIKLQAGIDNFSLLYLHPKKCMVMKTLLIFCLIIVLGSKAFAQKHLADSLLALAEKATGIQKAELINDAARYYLEYSPQKGLEFAEKALEIARDSKDTDQNYYALLTKANAYNGLGHYESAMATHLYSLEKFGDLISPSKLAQLHDQLGSVYERLHEYEKAIDHLLECADILDRFDQDEMSFSMKQLKISNLINTSRLFKELENYAKARHYAERAMEISRATGDSSKMMMLYNSIGILFEIEKDFVTAIDHYNHAARLAKGLGYRRAYARISGNIGQLYFFLDDYQSAIDESFKALEIGREINDSFIISFVSGAIGRTYLKMKQPDNALEYITHSMKVAGENNYPKLLGNSYEFLADYYVLKGDYKKAYYAKNEYAVIKDSIYEAEHSSKIAELETRYQTEKKKRQIEVLTGDADIMELKIKRRNALAYSSVGIIAMLLIVGFLWIGKMRQKQQLAKTKMEKKNLEIEQRLLRAQINPHFMFNALNSVQSYISANDNLKAMTYLAKFAQLMRNILENSMKPMITIEEEVNTLSLYMELEAMRFKDAFFFEINIDEKIIASKTYIPPMLIQPFVENSIKHGFSQYKGKGRLVVDFCGINGVVSCRIEDNGIGRRQSMQRSAGKTSTHRSLGAQLTHDRLIAMRQEHKVNARFVIEDLMTSDGDACGTRVLIDMPYEME
jgi:two-component system, LytTR family, sensor kinase